MIEARLGQRVATSAVWFMYLLLPVSLIAILGLAWTNAVVPIANLISSAIVALAAGLPLVIPWRDVISFVLSMTLALLVAELAWRFYFHPRADRRHRRMIAEIEQRGEQTVLWAEASTAQAKRMLEELEAQQQETREFIQWREARRAQDSDRAGSPTEGAQ